MKSVNPHDGETIETYQEHDEAMVDRTLEAADHAFREWRKRPFSERSKMMKNAARILRARKGEFASLMALEMGKVLADGEAEIEKCAVCCDHYADHAIRFLGSQLIDSDAAKSYVAYDPLGVVLAIMPWNFPFWQVFRFAAPAVMAGNVGVLKHASNVTGCALAIEAVFKEAGFPTGVFSTVLVPGSKVDRLIRHPAVKAVTLTGSTPAGKSVASVAGAELKKCVLELGGSDAYVVLEDADLDLAVDTCAKSRLINAGQSCIAAKRFIVVKSLHDEFERRYVEAFRSIRFGDPRDPRSTMGPLARVDLRDDVHGQVRKTIEQGARLLIGGEIPPGIGAYYPPTVLGGVRPGMVAFDEEIFGPVAAITEAADQADAIRLANLSPFGLGAAIFTRDKAKADRLAREIEAGCVFVNGLVKSDVRLPFGGVKQSGFGRELSWFGIQEFVNVKTIYHAKTNEPIKDERKFRGRMASAMPSGFAE